MRELELYDIQGHGVGMAITAAEISRFLKSANGDPVLFKIRSLGGDADEGLLIYDIIKGYKGKTHCEIIGSTASAGTIIAMACDYIESKALMLIHNSRSSKGGTVKDMKTAIKQMTEIDNRMVDVYKERTKLPEEKIRSLMEKEDWISPQEALEYGFIDKAKESYSIAARYEQTTYSKYLSNDLLIKLESKMKFPFRKKESNSVHLLALKDGSQILANTEAPEQGAEVAQIGIDSQLSDGEYELMDGTKIIVEGGMIKEVIKPEAQATEEKEVNAKEIVDEISAGVSTIVKSEVEKAINSVRAEFESKYNALAKVTSSHEPPKATELPTIEAKASPLAQVRKISSQIIDNIKKEREG